MNSNKLYTFFFFWLIFSGVQTNLYSQTVSAVADRDRIFIGEQITLRLSVQKAKAGINWFRFPDSVNHFEVIQRSKIDTVVNDSYTDYHQTVVITSFDSGRWQFPPLSVAGIKQSTLPVTINVLPVDVSQLTAYNDIKDIESVKPQNNGFITVVISLITLLAIAAIYWLLKRKKKAPFSNIPLKGNISPLEWALAELNKLNANQLSSPGEIKKYYADLANISRTFFSMQLQQKPLQQTTGEWMIDLQSLPIDNNIKIPFFQFLRLADTVKFAKYLPPASESETSVGSIKTMLQKASLLPSGLHSNYQPK